jgi:phenylpropionate dioxygenase-like ring-hydroxylating dioxygenase large terminal subunit
MLQSPRDSWLPFFVAADLTDARPVRPVRLLSETLVLFRGEDGRTALIQERCPHGGYPLIYASIDGASLMCARHQWHFDVDGNCFVVGYQGKIYDMGWAHARTYPVREHGGLLWTYLNEGEPPALPDLSSDDMADPAATLARLRPPLEEASLDTTVAQE